MDSRLASLFSGGSQAAAHGPRMSGLRTRHEAGGLASSWPAGRAQPLLPSLLTRERKAHASLVQSHNYSCKTAQYRCQRTRARKAPSSRSPLTLDDPLTAHLATNPLPSTRRLLFSTVCPPRTSSPTIGLYYQPMAALSHQTDPPLCARAATICETGSFP